MSEITATELAQQQVALLPDREALALVNINAILAAVNTGLAVNALTVNSAALAEAHQGIYVVQQ